MSLVLLFNPQLITPADSIASAEAVNAASAQLTSALAAIAGSEAFGTPASVLASAPSSIGSAEVLGTLASVLVSAAGGIISVEAVSDAPSGVGASSAPLVQQSGGGAYFYQRPRRPRPLRPRPDPNLLPVYVCANVGAIASAELVSDAISTLGAVAGRRRRREEELLLLHA